MKRWKLIWTAAALAAASPSWFQGSGYTANNREMAAIFADDQAPRTATGANIDWSVVGPADQKRRARTKQLLDTGQLRTGDDFYHAAMVFQHGEAAQDYMLAHTLSVIAAARGRKDATWLSAATLDRYLQSVGHSQIYGTQYRTVSAKTTQEPYDRALISDALRGALGVASQAEQEQRRSSIEQQYKQAGKAK
jgi:hypothetical protein